MFSATNLDVLQSDSESEVAAIGRTLLETAQTAGSNQDWFMSIDSTKCANKHQLSTYWGSSAFILWYTTVQNKPFCTFGQIKAPWSSLVGQTYLQLHWIISLIPVLQGGLENVPWSWRTFPLTDLHTPIHLWNYSYWCNGYFFLTVLVPVLELISVVCRFWVRS